MIRNRSSSRGAPPRGLAMRLATLALATLAGGLGGCGPHPPAHWAQGGSPLPLPRARWTTSHDVIDLLPDGRVLVDGDFWFSVDQAGRVFEPDGDPIALLEPDGRLVGRDDRDLGRIGLHNASLPGRPTAWLSVGEQGEITRFDEDGAPHPYGFWAGCGPAVRACTLVTHVVSIFTESRQPHVGFGIGVGVGFWH